MAVADILGQYGVSTDPAFLEWLQSSGNAGQIEQAMAGGNAGDWDPTPWLQGWYQQYQQQGYAHANPADELPQMWPDTPAPPPPPPQGPAAAPSAAPAPAPAAAPQTGTAAALVPPDGWWNQAPPPPPQAPAPGTGGVAYAPGPAPSFSYQPYTSAQPFTAPTAGDILKDPSYQFRFDQGMKPIESSRAAQGILNGGGTAKALLQYGQDFASQEYKGAYDRSLQTYNTNEDNRFKAYTANELNAQASFAPQMEAWKTGQQANQRAGEFDYNSAYNTWVSQYNQWRNSRNDAFDQKFKVATA